MNIFVSPFAVVSARGANTDKLVFVRRFFLYFSYFVCHCSHSAAVADTGSVLRRVDDGDHVHHRFEFANIYYVGRPWFVGWLYYSDGGTDGLEKVK